MTGKTRYSRIAVTLPEPDLRAADRLAERLDRSRSWVVAEAVRRYVASPSPIAVSPLDPARSEQLRRDLALTPEQRVREAEQTALLTELSNPGRTRQPRTFSTYEEFLEWRRQRREAR